MAVQLPDELIVEILSILPAKSLLRCRSVCKSWLYLIPSTKFKLMHLHNFNQLNPRYLVRRWYDDKEWYNLHFDDEAFTLDRGTHLEFPFNISRAHNCFRIVGCCNGVVCLCDAHDCITYGLETIILWNPSIRRKLTLTVPMFYLTEVGVSYVILGFGYDKMSDDYKVVSLTFVDYPLNRPQMLFHGSLHLIASEPGVSHSSIMTFNISTEIFGEIQLPEFLAKEFGDTIVVSTLGESLTVIYCSSLKVPRMESGSTYMVWVMKEYKNPTSWTIIYNMHHPDRDMGKPLRLLNNGDMILELNNGDMIIHNHNLGCYVYVSGVCRDNYFIRRAYVDKYQESLALLDVGHSVPNEETMKALMMIENNGGPKIYPELVRL